MDIQKEIEEKCKIAIDNIYSNAILNTGESNNIFSKLTSRISLSENLMSKAGDECSNILSEFDKADTREFLNSGFLRDYLTRKNKEFLFEQ